MKRFRYSFAPIFIAVMATIALMMYEANYMDKRQKEAMAATTQEKDCETVTPRNQAQCMGPDTKKTAENCEKFLDDAIKRAYDARVIADKAINGSYAYPELATLKSVKES